MSFPAAPTSEISAFAPRKTGRFGTTPQTAGLVIVSKDTDFRERSYVEGFPPKVIWLDVGNAGTAAIAELLRHERQRIEHFEKQEETSLLILSIGPTAI